MQSFFVKRMESVLSDADMAHFDEQGYVVLKGAVTAEQYQRTVAEIENIVDKKLDDESTWYRATTTPIGFAELYHCASFWEIAQISEFMVRLPTAEQD
jgi:hypothetical protein